MSCGITPVELDNLADMSVWVWEWMCRVKMAAVNKHTGLPEWYSQYKYLKEAVNEWEEERNV